MVARDAPAVMDHRRLRQDATAVANGDGALLLGPCLSPDTLEPSFCARSATSSRRSLREQDGSLPSGDTRAPKGPAQLVSPPEPSGPTGPRTRRPEQPRFRPSL